MIKAGERYSIREGNLPFQMVTDPARNVWFGGGGCPNKLFGGTFWRILMDLHKFLHIYQYFLIFLDISSKFVIFFHIPGVARAEPGCRPASSPVLLPPPGGVADFSSGSNLHSGPPDVSQKYFFFWIGDSEWKICVSGIDLTIRGTNRCCLGASKAQLELPWYHKS